MEMKQVKQRFAIEGGVTWSSRKLFSSFHHSSFIIHHFFSAFVLLEVLVSLTILSVSLVMVMESFTKSLKASRQSRNVTIATALARELLEKWEVTPPLKGESQGDFGPEYPGFTYKANYTTETSDYEGVARMQEVGRLVELRRVSLDVEYAREQDRKTKPAKRLLHVETALTGAERFTLMARGANKVGFDD
jgi:Tfp pilus assembly protein PilV